MSVARNLERQLLEDVVNVHLDRLRAEEELLADALIGSTLAISASTSRSRSVRS